MPRRGAFEKLDVSGVNKFYPRPNRPYVGRRTPHIPRRVTPKPRFSEAPFANGKQNRFFGGVSLFGNVFRRSFKRVGHFSVLKDCAVHARRHGIIELNFVVAFFQSDDGLKPCGVLKMLLIRKVNFVRRAVDFRNDEFRVPSVLFDVQSQNVVAALSCENVFENHFALARVEAGNVSFALKTFIGHKPCQTFQNGVGAKIPLPLLFAFFGYGYRPYKRRVGRKRHVVAKVVFEIFHAPLGKRLGVLTFPA